MREDGSVVDRILLTKSGGFAPTGVGPAESPRAGGDSANTVVNLGVNAAPAPPSGSRGGGGGGSVDLLTLLFLLMSCAGAIRLQRGAVAMGLFNKIIPSRKRDILNRTSNGYPGSTL